MADEMRHPVALTRRHHLDLCFLAGGLCTGGRPAGLVLT
ncbi:hypothetical protein CFP59_08985 [Streptomyces malaysiensis subsp. malaysiensis]|nr:hypothetical protein CFP59_08985 [Streptomyces sp. M56]SCG07548.1 hypothetical protein GA0115260_108743 [Streptomyces sp. MnatMP-M27]